MAKRFPVVLILLLLLSSSLHAQSLSGRITSPKGETMPGVTIYVNGTTNGTISNADGYYQLPLSEGKHEIVVHLLGYNRINETVEVKGDTKKNFVIREEDVELETVFITDDNRDPAWYIIKEAIRRKDENRMSYDVYQFTSYQKTIFRDSISTDTVNEAGMMDMMGDILSGDTAAVKQKLDQELDNTVKSDSVRTANSSTGSPQADLLKQQLDSLGVDPAMLAALLGKTQLAGLDSLLAGDSIPPQLLSLFGSDSLNLNGDDLLKSLPFLLPLLSQTAGDSAGMDPMKLMSLLSKMDSVPGLSVTPVQPTPVKSEPGKPKAKPGISISDGSGEENESGILYLEESVSNCWAKNGKVVKTEVISGRVSGGEGNQAILGVLSQQVLAFDPYENMNYFPGLLPDGVVSPISGSATMYYNFKLLGSVKEHGVKSFKILVSPKNPYGPVFSGIIYITDSTYAVSGLDLLLTKKNKIVLADSVRIRQEYVPLPDRKWARFNVHLDMTVRIGLFGIGIYARGTSDQVTRDYAINPELPKGFFDNQLLGVQDSSGTRDTTYWSGIRPVPLDEEEKQNYHVQDSIKLAHESPEYLDSLSRRTRPFKTFSFISAGYHPINFRKKTAWDISSPLWHSGFNPIEGLVMQVTGERTWHREENNEMKIEAGLRYGFANHKLSWQLGYNGIVDARRSGRLILRGGDFTQQFSPRPQIESLVETAYDFLLKQNYVRLYQKKFVEGSYEAEWLNGLRLTTGFSWEDRSGWSNHSDYSMIKYDFDYTPNIPLVSHRVFSVSVAARFQPFNKYMMLADGKKNLGSKWPEFWAAYTAGIPVLGGSLSYQKVSGGFTRSLSLGTVGKLSLSADGGYFLQSDSVAFPDYFHVLSNQTIINQGTITAFNAMNYYSYSSLQYAQLHAEHNFRGFITKKLPLIRRLNLREFVGAHYLWTPGGQWLEGNIGLEYRFFHRIVPIRVDYHRRFIGSMGYRNAITVTLPALGNVLGGSSSN